MDWYLKVLKNYLGFGGRARRKEYWMFILVNIIFTFVLGLLDAMLGWQRAGGEGVLTTIYGVLIFLPWWAVQFRRLHDTDRSAWWLLLLLIPHYRLAYHHRVQLPEWYAGRQPLRPRSETFFLMAARRRF